MQYIIKKQLTENLEPTWRAMESLHKAGKARTIGVSNFTIANLNAVLKYAAIKPAVNQVEIHPFFPNTELIDYCNSLGIAPVAYSPLGSQGPHPTTGETVMTNKELNTIAEKKGVTLAQLLIAWGLKRGYAVLPKSSNEKRIQKNAQLIELTDEEFEAVSMIAEGRQLRFVNLKQFSGYDVWPEESK